jgi:hypothetical protein
VSVTYWGYAYNADAPAFPKGQTRPHRIFKTFLEFFRTSKSYIQS